MCSWPCSRPRRLRQRSLDRRRTPTFSECTRPDPNLCFWNIQTPFLDRTFSCLKKIHEKHQLGIKQKKKNIIKLACELTALSFSRFVRIVQTIIISVANVDSWNAVAVVAREKIAEARFGLRRALVFWLICSIFAVLVTFKRNNNDFFLNIYNLITLWYQTTYHRNTK